MTGNTGSVDSLIEMFRFVFAFSIVVQGLSQEMQQSNFIGDAKQMLTSADTYINITKKVANEFDKTFHHLERALNIFQQKDSTDLPTVGVDSDYKDCQCDCKCPPAGADMNTVEEMKGKIIALRSKLIDVAEGNTSPVAVNPDEINYYSKWMIDKGINLYLDMLLSFGVDLVTTESKALTNVLEEQILLARGKRSPMGCICSGHDDIHKTVSDLKDKADYVAVKIESFNAKMLNAGKFIKNMFLNIPQAAKTEIMVIKNYFKKKA